MTLIIPIDLISPSLIYSTALSVVYLNYHYILAKKQRANETFTHVLLIKTLVIKMMLVVGDLKKISSTERFIRIQKLGVK